MSTFNGYIGVVLCLLEDLDTPLAHEAIRLINGREWIKLCDLQADPAHYSTAHSYLLDAAACAILKKFKDFGHKTTAAAKKVAWEKWITAETQCYRTNQRFRDYCTGYYPDVNPRVIPILDLIRKNIAQVLGRLPRELLSCGHGKGATYLDVGRNCTVLHKMQSQPTVTLGARPLLPLFWSTAWGRALTRRQISDPLDVPGNRYVTVPKTVKTERSIAVEPSINIYFQLGVGREIRKRLKDVAQIDLDEGQSLHRALARSSSVTNAYATLDLSSASDTVSYWVVKYLLPDDWFSLLESLRSPRTLVKGRPHYLEKFSSMGNGFTFELETLIFWGICSAFSDERVFVYGDDIIVPVTSTEDVCGALNFFGFTLNREKSFSYGRFRESCGGDFFDGFDVRPFFLKEQPNEPHQWIAFANGLRLLGHRLSGDCVGLSPYVRRAHARVLEQLPRAIRNIKGPEHLGDTVVHDSDVSKWQLRIKHGVRYVKTWSPIGRPVPLGRFDPDVQLAALLYGVPSDGALSRDSIKGFKEKWVACPQDTLTSYPTWLRRLFVLS